MTTYSMQAQAIQWNGTNFTDVQAYMTEQSNMPGVLINDWSGWTATDNGDGTLLLTAPAPRKNITVLTGQWLVCQYGTVPNAMSDDNFHRFFVVPA